MLFHLLYEQLHPFFGPLRVFQYITVRTALASLTALLIGLALGPWFIQSCESSKSGSTFAKTARNRISPKPALRPWAGC